MDPNALATVFASALQEKKGRNVEIFDMRELVAYTDLFVLVTARNRVHVKALAAELRRVGKEQFQILPDGVEGLEGCRWVLVDFGDVVIHIFDEPMRGFYDLDALWADAPRLDVPETDVEPDDDDDLPLYTLP